MMKKAFAAAALAGLAMSAQAGIVINEGFENVAALQQGSKSGWIFANTAAGGTGGWVQGSAGVFGAQAGTASSFVSANYTNAPAGGQLDSWLITPEFSTAIGGSVSFWVRGELATDALGVPYTDYFSYGFSTGGIQPASFTLSTPVAAPVDGWQQIWLSYDAQGAGSVGRFAIRYTGPADSADYIGIDSLQVEVPEPASLALGAGGLLGLGALRRRQRA
jgi:hypothetical protein